MNSVGYLETGVLYCANVLYRFTESPNSCIDLFYLDLLPFPNRHYGVNGDANIGIAEFAFVGARVRTAEEIRKLLFGLEIGPADELEDQDLDFKEWNTSSMPDAVGLVVEMAVCMANGGGGTVVFGVNDRAVGREAAILGVPLEVDVNILKRRVYDSTDPKITPVFEDLPVAEGTGRVLIMQIYPGMPP